ncbi:MAG: hypothetical protein V4633_02005 [Pseudomonadota bacterium]
MIRLQTSRAVASALCFLFGALYSHAVSAQTPQNTTLTFEYDLEGNVKKVTNALAHVTTYNYDNLYRRTSETDAKNGITRYKYDGLDQLTEVKDARLKVTTYSVNGHGNLIQTVSGDTGTTDATYDEVGNMLTSIDAKQQRTAFKYDAINRVTLITYHDNSTVTYVYDQGPNAIGRQSQVTDASGTTQYAYDPLGRMTSETRTIAGAAYTTGYRFDSHGRLAGMTYPSGRSIDYVFDAMGRISQVSTTKNGTATPLLTQVSYQPFGPVKSVTFGNGRTQAREYDLDGRMASFTLSAQTMAVTYDAASRIKGIVDAANPANGNTYDYDVLDRLTNVATPFSAQTYDYDAVGNRTQKVNNSTTTNYHYEGSGNRLTRIGSQHIPTDANGSITDKGNATFTYDVRGRMVAANTAIGLVRYTLNSAGQRVRKETPTESTVFHYDFGGKLIAESTTAGGNTSTQEYVFLGDMPVAVLK